MLDLHLTFPREGHLEAVFHVFSYYRENHNPRFALDSTYPEIEHDSFKKNTWVEFYGNMKDAIPTDIPEPRGKSTDLRMHDDINHAREKATRWSSNWFLIFMNTDLIQWISKK